MTYVVSVDTCIPDGASDLDALQREGVLFLFRKGIDAIEAVEGPDGMEIEIVDSILAAHPGGALLKLFVDAPALEFAEDAVRGVVGEILERSELLSAWEITKCEVELHPELAQQSLDAADGPDAPPADLAARAAQHAEARAASTTAAKLTDEEAEAMRVKISALAPRLTAFGLDSFGWCEDDESGVDREHAALAAGALVYAIDLLVDQLFDDVEVLGDEGTTVEDCDGPLWFLEDLPEQFAVRYTALFARRFLVTAVSLTARLTRDDFVQLSCVAEELLLKFLLREAEVVLDTYGLLNDEITSAWEAFADEAYEDSDYEWLYESVTADADEGVGAEQLEAGVLDVENWFMPFDRTSYVHPYAANEAGEREDTA
ncbi:hypothetical protein [Streptomyces inhibens]|uniref:hypothetical protein n=1 Tax=Streptomyces inhibens TaxID=2293571 RepID=UPI001EE6D14B|nr:hypothetical protein [Streptomyces inhibens]UKY51230.1 hypothetical protein KI385_22080 [Streptomyces inhibens]